MGPPERIRFWPFVAAALVAPPGAYLTFILLALATEPKTVIYAKMDLFTAVFSATVLSSAIGLLGAVAFGLPAALGASALAARGVARTRAGMLGGALAGVAFAMTAWAFQFALGFRGAMGLAYLLGLWPWALLYASDEPMTASFRIAVAIAPVVGGTVAAAFYVRLTRPRGEEG